MALERPTIVIGTTGISDKELAELRAMAQRKPILWSPNMSVGGRLSICGCWDMAARMLDSNYDAEIVEAHHRHKVDAPSGTGAPYGER